MTTGYTSPARPGEPDVPEYRWIPAPPNPSCYNSITGCYGCAFHKQLVIRCSRIPCQTRPTMVAELVDPTALEALKERYVWTASGVKAI